MFSTELFFYDCFQIIFYPWRSVTTWGPLVAQRKVVIKDKENCLSIKKHKYLVCYLP